MQKITIITIAAAIILFGSTLVSRVSNAEQASPAPVQNHSQDQSLLDVSHFGQALPSDKLGALSGQAAVSVNKLDMMLSNANLNGYQNDNALNVGDRSTFETGYNSVTGNAFAGSNGFATIIQNSGNQVLIQNDLIVNVNMH